MLGAEQGHCAHRSLEKPGMLGTQDFVFPVVKMKNLCFYPESWELEVINSLAICVICWDRPHKFLQPVLDVVSN